MQDVFVSTFLGNRFYPLRPHIDDIEIEDIAHGLAYQCRFNGQTSSFYSVAQHSVLVASLVPDELKLAALLHDAAEAYLGDIVKPLKMLVPEFAPIEKRVMEIIGQRFCVTGLTDLRIKHADLTLLATEKRDLMPNSVETWSYLEGVAPLREKIEPLSPEVAKREFLEVWQCYTRLMTN